VLEFGTAQLTNKKKKQQASKRHDLEDDEDVEAIEFDSKDDLTQHIDQLNQKVHSRVRVKDESESKYHIFPNEEPVPELKLKELRREEMKLRLKVQETLDEFGRMSPEYAKALHSYGGNLHKQKRYDDLFVLAKEIVQIHETIDGPEHYNTGRALDNLGSAAFRVKDYQACEHAMKRAMYIFIQKFGPKSKEVLLLRGRMLTFKVKDAETTGGLSYDDYRDEL
jgi:tetratricopeptide (TPR) repeat protein